MRCLFEARRLLEEILYLMETQTAVLYVVTSVKYQEKTQEKIQKANVPQQQQQNLQTEHMQQQLLRKYNTCED